MILIQGDRSEQPSIVSTSGMRSEIDPSPVAEALREQAEKEGMTDRGSDRDELASTWGQRGIDPDKAP